MLTPAHGFPMLLELEARATHNKFTVVPSWTQKKGEEEEEEEKNIKKEKREEEKETRWIPPRWNWLCKGPGKLYDQYKDLFKLTKTKLPSDE